MKSPLEIVQYMLNNDAYSKWLGISILEVNEGFCKLTMTVHSEMLNGHQIAHGGISYAISDSALAFAANSRGYKAVSIETSIAHISPVFEGDTLIVICSEISNGKSIARYISEVFNQNNQLVARFNGTVFKKNESW